MNYRLRTHNGTCVFITLACLLWFGAAASHGATTRYVVPPGTPGVIPTSGYTTWATAATNIQTAINVTPWASDTIWVTNGTYYLRGSQIEVYNETLRSVNGMDKTIINGNYPAYTNRCIYQYGGVVTGFTIMNAYYPFLIAGYSGGGVVMGGGTLRNCLIISNAANAGGGVQTLGGKIHDCIISTNLCIGGGTGAGIYVVGSGIIISNCIVKGNATTYRGGGMFIYADAYTQDRAQTIFNCTFVSNRCGTAEYGGGASVSGSGTTFRNCLFVGNSGGSGAGLVYMYASNGKIQNCTFARNTGSAGLQWGAGSYGALVENCIIVSNATTYSGSSLATNRNNCTDSTISLGVNSGNITNNASFVNYATDNFRLNNNSPCINAGTNASWTATGVDLDGKMRIRYGTVDMGAYERIHEATFYRFH